MNENDLSKIILESGIEVHKTLGGPGLLESVYEESLAWELKSRGVSVQRQVEVPIKYKGRVLTSPLRLDLLVERLVIVEVKAVAIYNKIFEAQALTYLRLMSLRLAMVMNFGDTRMSSGTHRVVNGL